MRPQRKEIEKISEKQARFVKGVATLIVGLGTTKIVRDVIANNTSTETLPEKVTVTAASAAIGGIATEKTKSYTDAKIDEWIDRWNGKKNPLPTPETDSITE
jgi:hypothetical protein